MAAQLIKDMTGKWKAGDYEDTFSTAVHKLVKQKVKAGKTETVAPLEDTASEAGTSNVIDLTELLAKSLAKRKPGTAAKSSTGDESRRVARKRA
jgi:DNA end-binding protein Ku